MTQLVDGEFSYEIEVLDGAALLAAGYAALGNADVSGEEAGADEAATPAERYGWALVALVSPLRELARIPGVRCVGTGVVAGPDLTVRGKGWDPAVTAADVVVDLSWRVSVHDPELLRASARERIETIRDTRVRNAEIKSLMDDDLGFWHAVRTLAPFVGGEYVHGSWMRHVPGIRVRSVGATNSSVYSREREQTKLVEHFLAVNRSR